MTQFTLKAGRELEIFDNEVASSEALVFHHGTPSDATVWKSWLEYAASSGTRALAYSRAGYGQSARRVDRSVASVTDDLKEVLDSKGIGHFVGIGWSGGGPHALAGTLDRRCRGAIILAGVAQYGAPDLDFLDGMGPENHDEFGAALKGEGVLARWMEQNAIGLQTISGDQLREAFGGLVGPADKEVLHGAYAEDLAGVMRRALSLGFAGWIDDDLAFVKDWGFRLGEIAVPVRIWQGDQDLMVPLSHARWLAKEVPKAELSFVPGQGHISLVVSYRDQVLDQARELLYAAPSAA